MSYKIFWGVLISLAIAVSIWLLDFQSLYKTEKPSYQLAFVGPLSGQGQQRGIDMLNGVKMYIDEINAQGGVNGHQIELVTYDDLDQVEDARQIADKVIHTNALAILGHASTMPTLNVSSIYQQAKIPAITGSATHENITKNNDWYFRLVNPTDTQSQFLSYYLFHILQQRNASVIYDSPIIKLFNFSLAQHFTESFEQTGGKIQYVWSFDSGNKGVDEVVNEIIYQMKQADPEQLGAIFLSTSREDAVKLITKIRRHGINNLIIGANYMASHQFALMFNHLPEEHKKPGYFSDHIYANATIIFDVAGKQAQAFREKYKQKYNKEPSWRAATYYDATIMLVEALKNIDHKNPYATIKEKRRIVQQYLKQLNSEEYAIKGVTSPTLYFDEDGDIARPPVFGMFKDRQFISTMNQLEPVKCPVNNKGTLPAQQVIKIGDFCVNKIDMVYTGINVHRIDEIDTEQLTYQAEFDVWFRYRGDDNVVDIVFANAIEPIILESPIVEKQVGHVKYKRYRLKAKFKIQFSAEYQAYEQAILEMGFHHKEWDDKHLIYVADSLALEQHQDQSIDLPTQWQAKHISYYQSTLKKQTFGDPEYLQQQGSSKHSEFNFDVTVSKNQVSLRTLVAEKFSLYIALICLIGLIMSIFLHHRCLACYKQNHLECSHSSLKVLWVIKAIFLIFLIVSAEMVLIELFKHELNPSTLNLLLKVFEVSWWWLYAYLVLTALEEFVWLPLEKHTSQIIPHVLRNSVVFLVYMLAVMGVLAFVFDQKITSLLATSGVVAMIIGLAIQINISNIFSGIAINVERPFKIGNWVCIADNKVEGQVVNITWRTTRIRTFDGNIVSIPNSIAAESMINNYDFPDDRHWLEIKVHLDFEHSPQMVKDILMDAILSVEYVLREPAPKVNVILLEWSVEYTVSFCVRDYSQHKLYQTEATQTIWQYLQKADLPLARK